MNNNNSNNNPPISSDTADAAARFALLELDIPADEVVPEPAPVVEAEYVALPAAPTPEPEEVGVRAGEINIEGRDRAIADEKLAVDAGFTIAPPIYAIGSQVNEWGVENFKASRNDFDAMATVDEACGNLIDTVAAEGRRDEVVSLPNMVMLNDGQLHTRGNGTYPLSRRAFQGLCGFATPGGAGYLADCEPLLRAHNLNHWFAKGQREDKRATKAALKEWNAACDVAKRSGLTTMPPKPDLTIIDKEVTFRTRGPESDRELYSVVGPRYGEHDIDKIAQQIIDGCPPDARCDVTYDGYKARVNVLFHTDINPANAVAGEIFKAGALITTADDGTGSIKISAQLFRNLCLNLIIIDNARDLVASRRHFGQGIAEDVANGIEAAMAKVESFMVKWNKASVENILDTYGVQDIDKVLRALVFNKVVHVPGIRKREMYKRLRRAWEVECSLDGAQMYSRTTIVNAITRAAHTEEWKMWTTAEDLERTAGRLVYAKNLNLDISDAQAETLGAAV
jgi:hypothetical protein